MSTGFVLALTLLLGPAAAGGEPRTPGVEARLGRAEAAYRAGQFGDALEESRQAVKDAPTSRDALLALGGMAEFMGEFDEARGAYARAEAVAPGDVNVLYRSASLAVRLGDYDRALGLLDRITAAYPWWARWLFWYAPARFQSRLLRLNPGLAHIVQLEIDIRLEKGDLESARQLAWGYAIVERDRNYCAEARERSAQENGGTFEAFRLAALAQPNEADCVWWFGQWLTDEGYVRFGRLMVTEGTRVTPSPGNKASGQTYLRIRLGGGREIAKRAEQLALIGRQRYLRDGDVDGATQLLQEAVRLDPAFARPYVHLARIAWDQGNQAAAIAWLERAVEVDPNCWRAYRNLGRALAILGRYPEAEARLRKTVELFGDDTGGHLALAHVLYAEGKYDEYEAETRRAVAFAENWRQPLPEVRAFLERYELAGPGRMLPPMPDPDMIIGWNYD